MKSLRSLVSIALFGAVTTLPLCAEQPKEPPKAEVKKPEPPKKPARWKEMDYGTFISQAFVHVPSGKYDNNTGNWAGSDVTPRGVAVKLDTDWNAGLLFDTATMRVSCGWIGGPLNLRGAAFDGSHGPASGLSVPPLFQSTNGPGWANAEGKFDDPRKNSIPPLPPPGPVPADWAKYKGLYRHGDNVIFSYTVGKANVLEMPGFETKDSVKSVVRNIRIENGSVPTIIRLAREEGKTGASDGTFANIGSVCLAVSGAPEGARLEVNNDEAFLKLPAAKDVQSFKVFYANGADTIKAPFAELVKSTQKCPDLTSFTKGGPSRWNEEITTKGVLGTGDGAYVSDTITIPEDNPWKSWMRIGGFDFFADGTRAALSTWSGDVWIVSGIDDKLENLKWKRFATGIHHPLGLKIVNDEIYTIGNSQLTRLKDLNGDGEADFYECFNNDWETTTAFHAFCFDLHTDPEGNFVFAMGCPVRGGGRSFHRIAENHGTIMKVDRYGNKAWIYATGFRAPNGIGVSPSGQVTSGDNQGTFVPACPLNWVNEGSFNGVVDSAHFNKEKLHLKTTATVFEGPKVLEPSETPKPLCWFPMGGVDNSGGGQAWVTSDNWGPFKGDMLHLSYGQSSVYKVMYETIDNQVQGGVVKFPVPLTSSAMRARFNAKDGQLYVSGLKGWQTNAGRDGGFNRIRYTGKPVYMPKDLHIKKNGIEITYATALDKASVEDLSGYTVECWNYKWTHDYGSPDVSLLDPTKKNHDMLKVKSAKLNDDGKTLFFEVENIQPVMQYKLKLKLKAADGTPVNTEINGTIHNLGK